MAAKVSVIVPVFNSEKYLERCVESLVGQTLDEIEFIFVNDGSTDGSLEILNQYAEKYPEKVKVFTQENSGQGVARNFGIKQAQGEYIGFVDSDDYVEPGAFDRMYKVITKLQCDVAVAQYFKVSKQGKETIHSRLPFMVDTVYSGVDYLEECGGMFAIWNKLYKKEFIEKFSFPSIWFEDVAWTGIVMSHNPKVCYIDKPFYHYVRNEGSTVSSVRNVKTLEDSLQATKIALENCLEENKDIVVYAYARLLLFQAKKRPMYATEYYKLLHEMREQLTASAYYQEDVLLQKQTQLYVKEDWECIPYFVYYDNFGKEASDKEMKNKASWETLLFSPCAELICLNEDNCDVEQFPAIKQAYDAGNFQLTGHYFKCQAILKQGGCGVSKDLIGMKNMTPLLAKSRGIFSFLTPGKLNSHFYAATAKHPVMEDLVNGIEKAVAANPLVTFEEILVKCLFEEQNMVYNEEIETDFKHRYTSCYENTVKVYATSAFSFAYGIAPTFSRVEEELSFAENGDAFFYETLQDVIPAYVDYKVETEVSTNTKPLILEIKTLKKQRQDLKLELKKERKRLKNFNDLSMLKKIYHIIKYKTI